ncbi:coronin-7 [Hirundo rustica]|uniref:coronin-7 n=1 Tax=Hirundo rustica TaxID=43150 RepID=UPI0026717935|nr:coronin-7 [Hirundo rustica]
MNRFKASKFRHTEARLPRREAWISGIRAGSVTSCGNHVKASCRWIAFNAEAAGVLGIVPLECEDGGKRTISQLCCHSDVVTDFDFSPFDQLLLATGSADEMVKVWRLPESGQDIPGGAGLTLGPGGAPVDALQFHPHGGCCPGQRCGEESHCVGPGAAAALTGHGQMWLVADQPCPDLSHPGGENRWVAA